MGRAAFCVSLKAAWASPLETFCGSFPRSAVSKAFSLRLYKKGSKIPLSRRCSLEVSQSDLQFSQTRFTAGKQIQASLYFRHWSMLAMFCRHLLGFEDCMRTLEMLTWLFHESIKDGNNNNPNWPACLKAQSDVHTLMVAYGFTRTFVQVHITINTSGQTQHKPGVQN